VIGQPKQSNSMGNSEKSTTPGLTRLHTVLLLAAAVMFLAACVSVARTRPPWCDEAWFGSAGFNLATHGKLITPIIAPAPDDPKTIGLGLHTYWVMPLHLVFQAGWYKVFGFSLFTLRSVSIVWGLVALWAWFLIMRALTGNVPIAILTVWLLATDFVFIMQGADGRMDMMAAALGYAALAVYLVLRERSLNLAIFCAHSLVVLSGLTHPNGGLLSLAGVVFLMFYYDRRSIHLRHLLLAAIPYLVGLAGWSMYLAEDPKLFLTQFRGNASGRLNDILRPWIEVRNEIEERYLAAFGFQRGAPAIAKVKVLLLLSYVAGLVGTLSVRALRRQRGIRVLLILAAINWLYLTLQSVKHPAYLVYSIPFLAAFLAIWIVWCWNQPNLPSPIVAVGLAGFIALQLAAVANVVVHDKYRRTYLPATAFLKAHAEPQDLVVGEPEMGFALGFDSDLLDDSRLGYYSHVNPSFIVVGENYRGAFERFQLDSPATYQYVTTLLQTKYHPVFQNDEYTIFVPLKQEGR
jgi:4-amino-4-deoxy-L-arabinose transferase-like glycosyltransferase